MQDIYLVPLTHYDVVWAFTREEYLTINESILEDALAMMENSDFKFCIEQTYLLQEIEKRNPELWQRIYEMIKADKFYVVDGQYLMPDSMLPIGEVLVREILFGKRYCQQKLGIDVPVAWAADSFGMNAQTPQIYKKAGYKWFAFRRGARRDIQESEFMWEGLDGSTILTHWMPMGYRAGLIISEWEQSLVNLSRYAATSNILMPAGSGSMPPQPEIPGAVKKWNQTHPMNQMKITAPEEFFQKLESTGKKFAVIKGELYDDELAAVFPQVCSTRIWVIQNHRICENQILVAEQFATIAWLLGAPYPNQELGEAWELVLFTAFHDVIGGCGVDEVYEDVKGVFTALKTKLDKVLNGSLNEIAQRINTGGKGTVVFNPISWPVRNWIQVGDESGFIDEVPSLGYRVYHETPVETKPEGRIQIKGNRIETAFWNLEVDENTGIITVWDKNGELKLSGNEIVIEDEVGDLYRHRSRFSPEIIKSESGEGFQYSSFKPKSFRIEEDSSKVKVIFENEFYCLTWPYRLKERFPPRLYKYKTLDITKEVTVFRDIPRIEFTTRIDNKYPNIRLRVKFKTGINRKMYYRETQFGVICEPTEYFTKQGGVKPSGVPNFLNWFDVYDGVRGITFMNKGLPAVEIVEDSVYITLFRSVSGLSADGSAGPLVPTPDALELGALTFEYAVLPHDGDWQQAEVYRPAREYQYSPIAIEANGHGDLPSEFSFLKLSPDSLMLSALKKAEDTDEVILRFYETKGEATQAQIELFKEIKKLTRVDLLEREEGDLPFTGNTFSLEVKPFEIVSLKLGF